jgi:hypothetical protein
MTDTTPADSRDEKAMTDTNAPAHDNCGAVIVQGSVIGSPLLDLLSEIAGLRDALERLSQQAEPVNPRRHDANRKCVNCEKVWGEHTGYNCPNGITFFELEPAQQQASASAEAANVEMSDPR